MECAGKANRGPRRGSRAGVVVAATALWFGVAPLGGLFSSGHAGPLKSGIPNNPKLSHDGIGIAGARHIYS